MRTMRKTIICILLILCFIGRRNVEGNEIDFSSPEALYSVFSTALKEKNIDLLYRCYDSKTKLTMGKTEEEQKKYLRDNIEAIKGNVTEIRLERVSYWSPQESLGQKEPSASLILEVVRDGQKEASLIHAVQENGEWKVYVLSRKPSEKPENNKLDN